MSWVVRPQEQTETETTVPADDIEVQWCLNHGSGLDKFEYPSCDYATSPVDGKCRMVRAWLSFQPPNAEEPPPGP